MIPVGLTLLLLRGLESLVLWVLLDLLVLLALKEMLVHRVLLVQTLLFLVLKAHKVQQEFKVLLVHKEIKV
jgi:hypothetical protein